MLTDEQRAVPNPLNCRTCYFGRIDPAKAEMRYWCALQRLGDPLGLTIVRHDAVPRDFRIGRNGRAQWSGSRVRSPGFAEGTTKSFHTGEVVPHFYQTCSEFNPIGATETPYE